MGSRSSRADNDRKRRAKLRAKLRAEGVNEQLIDRIIEQQRWDDLVARVGLDQARVHANAYAHSADPDDVGYKPTPGDPLFRGAARVEGVAAKVVRRGETITRFQYDREAGS